MTNLAERYMDPIIKTICVRSFDFVWLMHRISAQTLIWPLLLKSSKASYKFLVTTTNSPSSSSDSVYDSTCEPSAGPCSLRLYSSISEWQHGGNRRYGSPPPFLRWRVAQREEQQTGKGTVETLETLETLPPLQMGLADRILDVTTCETIFIWHALANDLRVLRITTDRVIDSMAMMSRAVFGDAKKFPRNWGLKTACQELLDVTVQKKHGLHDPLEDTLATRELVLQFVLNPEKLAECGARTRANLARIVQKEQAKQEAKIEKKKCREAEKAEKSPEQLVQEAADRPRGMEERQRAKTEEREAEIQRRKLRRAEKREKREKSRILGK
ncbi:hypothetical protein CHU98_g8152 [Xylaria longipes]|nr:hypothetical protein CHU98_g8152 [Xylaria longipes]